jgi:2,4-dienoyl-CoA reductase-like NADH-dependent reductase (Old Yellow Enzyme family)
MELKKLFELIKIGKMEIKNRAKTGADFVIGYRISGDEHTPGGLTWKIPSKSSPG